MLLGAPERKMKMQFFAVLRSATFGAAVRACSRRGLSDVGEVRGHEAGAGDLHEAAAREAVAEPSGKPLALSQVGHSIVLLVSFAMVVSPQLNRNSS